MAGAGYKLFATGDVLTAAQVNTFLMQQTTMVFASSAARTSALSGVLAEGMVSYLQDTNTLEVYDGAAWIGATGDITALTAGTGISITNPTGPVPTVAIDTAVTADLTTAQTLTNKTLTSPVLTTPSISNINAKGDILVGTADNTLGIITAGSNGDTLVADSSTSTGLRYQADFAAGKNKIINGDFGIWQRGTTISAGPAYTCDRWIMAQDTGSPTYSVSQQSFTAGTAPVAGYEGTFFARFDVTAVSTATTFTFLQKIEDVRQFAGQTITVSLWAKSNASRTLTIAAKQNFGSGGSATVTTTVGTASVTTSWARYSVSVAIPTISGKTIGSGSNLEIALSYPAAVMTNDFWGVQVEAGSVATAFQTASGSIQGELALCQRYYHRTSLAAFGPLAIAATQSTTAGRVYSQYPVTMRTAPSFASGGTITLGTGSLTSVTGDRFTTTAAMLALSGSSFIAGGANFLYDSGSATAYFEFSSEL